MPRGAGMGLLGAALLAAALLLAMLPANRARAAEAAWTRYDLAAGNRMLAAASPALPSRGAVLTVFIEGDGAAHDARGRPSRDPTPRDAVALRIAKAWPGDGPKAWLGRLCQYEMARDRACAPDDWTRARFSAPAIEATNAALDTLKGRAGAQRLVLVGWSGGGTVAALAAARRTDVEALATLAAPLDLAAWTEALRLSPLPADGDPALAAWRATPVRQLHLYGGRDRTVPASTQRWAAERMGGRTMIWPAQGHQCCWARRAGEIAAALDAAPQATRTRTALSGSSSPKAR